MHGTRVLCALPGARVIEQGNKSTHTRASVRVSRVNTMLHYPVIAQSRAKQRPHNTLIGKAARPECASRARKKVYTMLAPMCANQKIYSTIYYTVHMLAYVRFHRNYYDNYMREFLSPLKRVHIIRVLYAKGDCYWHNNVATMAQQTEGQASAYIKTDHIYNRQDTETSSSFRARFSARVGLSLCACVSHMVSMLAVYAHNKHM